jgi:hypothetical protein
MFLERLEWPVEACNLERNLRREQAHPLLTDPVAINLNRAIRDGSLHQVENRFLVQGDSQSRTQIPQHRDYQIRKLRHTWNGSLPTGLMHSELYSIRVSPLGVHELMLNILRPDIKQLSVRDVTKQ